MRRSARWQLLFAIIIIGAPLLGQQPSMHYRVTRKILVDSGATGYLAIDTVNRRLFGIGSAVVDIDHDSIVGKLADNTGQAFALAPDIDRGLGRGGILFDLKELRVIRNVGETGVSVVYDPMSRHGFLIDVDSVVAIDMLSGSVLGHISLHHGVPGNNRSGIADGDGRLFVNVIDFPTAHTTQEAREQFRSGLTKGQSAIAVLDTRSLNVIAAWPLPDCGGLPTGLSFDKESSRLFVSCPDRLLVVDAGNGRQIYDLPIEGQAARTDFDTRTKLLFLPTSQSKLVIVREDNPNHYSVADIVPTIEGSDVVVVDSRTHRAFLYSKTGRPVRILILEPTADQPAQGD
jgi:hypothetical protein